MEFKMNRTATIISTLLTGLSVYVFSDCKDKYGHYPSVLTLAFSAICFFIIFYSLVRLFQTFGDDGDGFSSDDSSYSF